MFLSPHLYYASTLELQLTANSLLHLKHVSRVCRVACFNLHRVSKIRHHLDAATAKQLIHAVVITHLDYCNAIFHGLSATLTNRLQRIQNNAARLILRVGRREHIRRHLAALHWLSISQRSTLLSLKYLFKVAVMSTSRTMQISQRFT